jgi:stringent starvation protein B
MVPISAVLAIYARETGQGMALPDDVAGATGPEGDDEPPSPSTPTPEDAPAAAKRPHLRVVK